MKKLIRINMEFEVEWDEEKRAEWGGGEPDEKDVERRVFYSLLMHGTEEQRNMDDMRIVGAEKYIDSFYRTGECPKHYKCTKCGASKVKLWRQVNTMANCIELLCGPCAMENQGKTGHLNEDGTRIDKYGQTIDQIGWLVPAIPDEENYTYWGYSSVPSSGVRWWKALPLKRIGDKKCIP